MFVVVTILYASNMTVRPRLVLFARFPVPGRAKTRLIPALGPQGAAGLHRRLTERTLATLMATGLPVEIRTTGAPASAFRRWLGEVDCVPQGRGHLGARMRRAAADGPAVLVGADVPDLRPDHLLAATEALQRTPVVIGPAEDGGYYLIGLRAPLPWLFAPMAWGTEVVRATTLDRLTRHGVAATLLEPLPDLDIPDDLRRWPDL
jgi:rSAM/selenodomain-associated transferase 1